MTAGRLITTFADRVALLQRVRTVAVLGAHHEAVRAAFYVPAWLHRNGYRVLPVNPTLVGRTLFGEPVVGTLADLPAPVDLVNVFRRPDQLPPHLPELLALRPKAVWFQLGIRHDAVAAALCDAGIDVVQDACTLADHKAAGLPPLPEP